MTLPANHLPNGCSNPSAAEALPVPSHVAYTNSKPHTVHCTLQVEKEKDSLRLELSNAKSNINDAEAALASQKAQLEKLNHVVAEADAGMLGLHLHQLQWHEFETIRACRQASTSSAACAGSLANTNADVISVVTLQSGCGKRRSWTLFWASATSWGRNSSVVMTSWRCCTRRSRYSRARSAEGKYSTGTGDFQEP